MISTNIDPKFPAMMNVNSDNRGIVILKNNDDHD